MSTIVFSHVFFSYGTLPVTLTSPSRVAPPTASSLSAQTGSASQRYSPRSGSRLSQTPESPAKLSATQLVPPIHRPRGRCQHRVPLASALRSGTGVPHRRTAHRCRHVRHPRAGGTLASTSPGTLPRDEAIRPRPGSDDHADADPSTRASNRPWGLMTWEASTAPAPRLPLPRAACPPAPGPHHIDRPDALVLDEPTNHWTLTGAGT